MAMALQTRPGEGGSNINKRRREEGEKEGEDALQALVTTHLKNWRSYITLPAVIFALLRRDREEYRQLASRLILHEFRQPRYTPDVPIILHHRLARSEPVSYEQQPMQLRRVIFAEEDQVLSFVLICDEFPRQSLAYVACVEHSGYGKNLIRPMLQAYARYMAFTQPGVQLYIWADPPNPPIDGNSYVFGNRPSLAPARSREYLYELYQGILAGTGIEAKEFEPSLSIPPLPPYVAASEQDLYADVQRTVRQAEAQVRSLFRGTMVATLSFDPRAPKIPTLFIPATSVPLFDWKAFCKKSDFSTREQALASTAAAKASWRQRPAFSYFPATIATGPRETALLADAIHEYVAAVTTTQ